MDKLEKLAKKLWELELEEQPPDSGVSKETWENYRVWTKVNVAKETLVPESESHNSTQALIAKLNECGFKSETPLRELMEAYPEFGRK